MINRYKDLTMKEKAFLVEEMQKYKEIIVHHHWR
jgi:hypothetical protein